MNILDHHITDGAAAVRAGARDFGSIIDSEAVTDTLTNIRLYCEHQNIPYDECETMAEHNAAVEIKERKEIHRQTATGAARPSIGPAVKETLNVALYFLGEHYLDEDDRDWARDELETRIESATRALHLRSQGTHV